MIVVRVVELRSMRFPERRRRGVEMRVNERGMIVICPGTLGSVNVLKRRQ